MTVNIGQKSEVWDKWWNSVTPLSEIQMWDYYGGRQWVCKYVPRNGKVVEAGCGLGRFVFYLSKFNIDIEGIDFSQECLDVLNKFQHETNSEATFSFGDVTNLPYEDNTLSGYLSFGVVEHFKEGPHVPIKEAYRVLRPGGIAIITTPNISLANMYFMPKKKIKILVKKLLGYPPKPFFQYEYSPKRLKKFIEKEGFIVTRYSACDLFYAFREIIRNPESKIIRKNYFLKLLNKLENSGFKNFGSQSITISVKPAPLMYCFISGELNATIDSLEHFDVPISKEFQNSEIASFFRKGLPVRYAQKYSITPHCLQPEERVCSFSGKTYISDVVFEDFGFNRNVCPELLRRFDINVGLSVENIKPILRYRKGK